MKRKKHDPKRVWTSRDVAALLSAAFGRPPSDLKIVPYRVKQNRYGFLVRGNRTVH